MHPASSATLQRLLDENARFALGARGTTNHCPMALIALAQMGASPARLQAFFDRWTEKYALAETQPCMALMAESWLACAGNDAAFSSLKVYFAHEIAQHGRAQLLQQVFSGVPLAPATGAFHAIIRIAYGLESAHEGEVAAGLAAYVCNNLPISIDLTDRAPASSVYFGLDTLSTKLGGSPWPGSAITGRLRDVAADPAFQSALPAPPDAHSLLDDMAAAAIHLYWQTSNFTVLHMVTGAYAARLLCAQLPVALADDMLAAMWSAFCAAYVSVGAPALVLQTQAGEAANWPEMLGLAVESDDDHVIKMVYTCFREWQRQSALPYQAVARRLVAGR